MASLLRLLQKFPIPSLTRGAKGMASEKLDVGQFVRAPVVRADERIKMPNAQYGGRSSVTMLPGGGIGPEMMKYVLEIFQTVGAPVDFEVIEVHPDEFGDEEFEYAITSIRRNRVAIKGNIETKSTFITDLSRNITLRNKLDLYVNVLHCKSLPGIPAKFNDLDIVLVRQNTDGEYAMLEHAPTPQIVESLKVMTTPSAERVSRFAFELARRNKRKKVTTIHKANIMKFTDGLWLDVAREVAKEYDDIEHNDMIVDNTCMQIVSNPYQFDVLNLPNLYGSIVGNVVCGLVNGAGRLTGRNYGYDCAVFETGTRNTGTALVGKNCASPIAMIKCAVDMLWYLGYTNRAKIIADAIHQTLIEDKIRTRDLGGTAKTTEVVENIVKHVERTRVFRAPRVHRRRTMYELS